MSQTEENSKAMSALRLKILTASPSELGAHPSKDFPRIYGVVMDWPVNEEVFTVCAISTGDASLYSTSTFGIIGGCGHEGVRAAAVKWVKIASSFLSGSTDSAEQNYPRKNRLNFYLLTFQGLRVIDADLNSVQHGTDPLSPLFGAAQNVLGQLRKIAETQK